MGLYNAEPCETPLLPPNGLAVLTLMLKHPVHRQLLQIRL